MSDYPSDGPVIIVCAPEDPVGNSEEVHCYRCGLPCFVSPEGFQFAMKRPGSQFICTPCIPGVEADPTNIQVLPGARTSLERLLGRRLSDLEWAHLTMVARQDVTRRKGT